MSTNVTSIGGIVAVITGVPSAKRSLGGTRRASVVHAAGGSAARHLVRIGSAPLAGVRCRHLFDSTG